MDVVDADDSSNAGAITSVNADEVQTDAYPMPITKRKITPSFCFVGI